MFACLLDGAVADELLEYLAAHPVPGDVPQLEQEYLRNDASKSGDVTRAANAAATEFFMSCDDPLREVSIVQVCVCVALCVSVCRRYLEVGAREGERG